MVKPKDLSAGDTIVAKSLGSISQRPTATQGRARVLAIGGMDELTRCLWTVQLLHELEIAGVVPADAGVPGIVEALRPDLALVCCDTDASEMLEVLRRMREYGRHQCDVLLVAGRLGPDMVLNLARLGVFSCLIAPVDPQALRNLLEVWLGRWRLVERKAPGDLLDQNEVNLLLHGRGTGGEQQQPATSTLGLVAMALRDSSGPLSASEVGRLCNLSAVASRRYLKELVHQGAAVMTMQYGKTGRPRHLYCWSPELTYG